MPLPTGASVFCCLRSEGFGVGFKVGVLVDGEGFAKLLVDGLLRQRCEFLECLFQLALLFFAASDLRALAWGSRLAFWWMARISLSFLSMACSDNVVNSLNASSNWRFCFLLPENASCHCREKSSCPGTIRRYVTIPCGQVRTWASSKRQEAIAIRISANSARVSSEGWSVL